MAQPILRKRLRHDTDFLLWLLLEIHHKLHPLLEIIHTISFLMYSLLNFLSAFLSYSFILKV